MPYRESKKEILGIILAILVMLGGSYLIATGLLESRSPEQRERINMDNDEIFELPSPNRTGELPVEETIEERRSIRSYTEQPLDIEEVSQLLWSAQGITSDDGKRAAPSAGATYPLETYLVVDEGGVEGLERGVYRYIPEDHILEKVMEEGIHEELSSAALGQSPVEDAPVNIVITAVYERTKERYGERGKRYVHMEAGHAAQNIYLQSEALDLGTVVIGAFNDGEVQEVMDLPTDHEPLYIMPVGNPG